MNNQPSFQQHSGREINLNPSAVFNCKISPKGLIEYANHHFCNITGYEEYELIGEPMDALHHADMPKVFFQIIFERLQKKESIRVFGKFKTKDKRFFWLMVDFKTKTDDKGVSVAHYASSKPAPRYAVHKIEVLYKILSKIEEKTGETKDSRRYLVGFLEERKLNYNQFVEELSISHPEYEQPFVEEKKLMQNVASSAFKEERQINQDNFRFRREINTPKKKSLLKKLFGK